MNFSAPGRKTEPDAPFREKPWYVMKNDFSTENM
jgi:hypothetical protein